LLAIANEIKKCYSVHIALDKTNTMCIGTYMGTVIIIFILLVIILTAVKSILNRILHGSACCGERDAPEKKVKVQDKNKSHYPYKYILSVDGMHCSNCTRHVENALNSIDGIWAAASLEKKSVTVLSKMELEPADLESEVQDAGYTVLAVTKDTSC